MSEEHKFLFGEDQLANMIALYESYVSDIEGNLISEREMEEKGELFLQWVNDLLASKLKRINQIAQHSIDVFRHLADQQLQLSQKFMDLENETAEKSTTIQNHLYTIRNLQNKLSQRENDIDKLRLQITELTDKIDKQETKFKRQAKQYKKTFRIIQENNESDKQIFDSIQLEYEYERNQKDILKNDLQLLTEQHSALKKQLDQTKRLFKASQNKLEWEIKKKISLEEVIKEKNQLVEKLLIQIADLKQALNQSEIGIDHQHLHDKYFEEGHNTIIKPLSKNILSEEMAFRQSFSSEIDMDDEFVRKNSLRKSFDEGSVNALQGAHFDYVINGDDETSDYDANNKRSVAGSVYDHNTLSNNNGGHFKSRSNKSSFYHQQAPHINNTIKEEPSPKASSNEVSINHSSSPQSMHINDHHQAKSSSPFIFQNGSTEIRYRSPSDTSSPEIKKFEPLSNNMDKPNQQFQVIKQRQQQDELQIITQKVQSSTHKEKQEKPQLQQKQEQSQQLESVRRYAPDLYFAHFLLTSQSVKIKEDCEQMLNIDVKQYYPEVVQKRVPMHVWDDWIREKLRVAAKAIKERYNQERRAFIKK